MPPNTVSVARPGQWGNPWRVGRDGDAAYCVEQYRRNLRGEPHEGWPKDPADRERAVEMPFVTEARIYLAGKDLACWCKPGDPCHADVLIELANA